MPKMTPKTLRNRRFVKNLVVKGMNQGQAYAAATGHKKTTPSDYNSGHRLVKRDDVQAIIRQQRQQYARDASRAYANQWDLAGKETTPPHVKMGFYKEVQDRAGLGAIDMHYTEVKHKYDDLTMSRNELLELIREPQQLTDNKRLKGDTSSSVGE